MNVKDIGPREGRLSLAPHLLRSANAEPLATTRVFFDVFRLPPVSVKVTLNSLRTHLLAISVS